MNEYIVYVKINESNYIISINSSAFLSDTSEWIEIDRGNGDKYHHVQGNYFEKTIVTENGAYRYKLVDGKPEECNEEEINLQLLPSIKLKKVQELSEYCNSSINNGMEIQLSEDVKEYFTYSLDDQANISEMFNAIILGAENYPYHASGKECRMYSTSEIVVIYSSLSTLKTHHLTYYNQLRAYTESLTNYQDIDNVTYGQELTGQYLEKYNNLIQQANTEMSKVLSKVQNNV